MASFIEVVEVIRPIQWLGLALIILFVTASLIALGWHLETTPHPAPPAVGTVSHTQNNEDLREEDYFYYWNPPQPNFPSRR
ncbi:MAG: hypothetical protein M5U01_07455 [Ardenticatenaceae bacterium]|nr:hypothetical protein [Ardenticatenaceae bacterium]